MSELDKLKELSQKEQRAFIAWFHGGNQHVTQYQSEKHAVFMGKAECQWVDFEEFWIGKLQDLGWVNMVEQKRGIALGMVGTPEYIEFKIVPTDKGWDVLEAYRNRLTTTESE